MKHHLFCTPLFEFHVPESAMMKKALVADILAWRDSDPVGLDRGRKRSTWESRYTAHERPAFAPLVSAIEACAGEIMQGLTISGMWANIAEPLAYRTPHYHSGAIWTGIYFLALPEGAPSTTFLDPRGGAPHVLSMGFRDRVELPSTEGQLFVFPVFLSHYVGRHMGFGDRITVACNLGVQND